MRGWFPTGHVLPQSSEDKAERAVLIELYPSPDSYRDVRKLKTLFIEMACKSMFLSLQNVVHFLR